MAASSGLFLATIYNQSQLAEIKHVACYWSINTAATAVPLSAHPSPLVITTKLVAAILGVPLFGGGALPASTTPVHTITFYTINIKANSQGTLLHRKDGMSTAVSSDSCAISKQVNEHHISTIKQQLRSNYTMPLIQLTTTINCIVITNAYKINTAARDANFHLMQTYRDALT